MNPIVSVVIPTYNRPILVKRAVHTALNQTLKDIEVVVVIDGLNPERENKSESTERVQSIKASLSEITDPRLRIIEKAINESYTAARMTGVYAAKGTWVAHLDDDDEWMPEKLEKQVKLAETSENEIPIISCYTEVRFADSTEVLPRRLPLHNEHLSEYLFVRQSPFYGDALIQTSSILMPRKLILDFPMKSNIHGDWGWMLDFVVAHGAGDVEFVPEALSIWNLDGNRSSLSRSISWQESLDWIRDYRSLVTPRAYSAFLLTEVASRASSTNTWEQLLPILWEALRLGRPRLRDISLYFGLWLIKPKMRSWLRSFSLLKKEQQESSTLQPM